MLDIGFSELLLIVVVAIIFVGPKDLPVVVRYIARILHDLRSFFHGVKRQFNAIVEEAGIAEMKDQMTTIIDLEGKAQIAYDVNELESLKKPAEPNASGEGST